MPAHVTPHRVRFHELDPYDHVNHSVYVTYFEIGRVDALDAIDLGIDAMKEIGIQFVVTRIEVRFRRPATSGDDLEIHTAVGVFGRASTEWHQEITRDGEQIATAKVRVAVTDQSGKPIRPPAEILAQFNQLAAESNDE